MITKPLFFEVSYLLVIHLDISLFNLLLLNNYLSYLTLPLGFILHYFDHHHLLHLQDLIPPSINHLRQLLLLFYLNPPHLHHAHNLLLLLLLLLHLWVLILKLLFLPLLIPIYLSIPFHFTIQSRSGNPPHYPHFYHSP